MVFTELILTVSTLRGCGSLERTGFNSFYFEGCGGLESPGFNSFYFVKVCSGLERTDFNSFYFARVWMS